MLLTLDVGNSNITCGIFRKEILLSTFRIITDKNQSLADYKKLFAFNLEKKMSTKEELSALIISSVVPDLNDLLEKVFVDDYKLEPFFVNSNMKLNITLNVDDPTQLGSDRIVNAVGGFEKVKSEFIVVDFGTATTFDCISRRGEFLGGLIAPGINTSAEALFNKTSKLPKVELSKPKNLIGKNSIECIQSGLVNGYSCMVEGLLSKLKSNMGCNPFVIATGGLAQTIINDCPHINEIDKSLTLKGLKIIYELNC